MNVFLNMLSPSVPFWMWLFFVLAASGSHDCCLVCLGCKHAKIVFIDNFSTRYESITMMKLQSLLAFLTKAWVPSAAIQTNPSVLHSATLTITLGGQRIIMQVFCWASPHGTDAHLMHCVPSSSRVMLFVHLSLLILCVLPKRIGFKSLHQRVRMKAQMNVTSLG